MKVPLKLQRELVCLHGTCMPSENSVRSFEKFLLKAAFVMPLINAYKMCKSFDVIPSISLMPL